MCQHVGGYDETVYYLGTYRGFENSSLLLTFTYRRKLLVLRNVYRIVTSRSRFAATMFSSNFEISVSRKQQEAERG